jgi:antitoxin component of MazEF toxin-antitoxin module
VVWRHTDGRDEALTRRPTRPQSRHAGVRLCICTASVARASAAARVSARSVSPRAPVRTIALVCRRRSSGRTLRREGARPKLSPRTSAWPRNVIVGHVGRAARANAAGPLPQGSLGFRGHRRRTSAYILVVMKIVKVRRVGNSNVVSIPREFEASGYVPGSSVLVEDLGDGELRILPTDRVRERVRQVATRVVSERSEAMAILANHDPDDADAGS